MRILLIISVYLSAGLLLRAQPNLVPYHPNDWSAAIVVSTNPGDYVDDPILRADQDLYIDWAVANLSNSDVTDRFVTEIYVDDVLRYSWVRESLGADRWNSSDDNNIGKLPAGQHTIRMEVDAGSVVAESNEGDNRFVRQITVQATGGGGQTHQVDFRNSEFVPNEITIQVGDTVEFTNRGGLHTVTGTGADPFCGSDAVPVSCRVTFSEAGVFPYRCLFHSSAGPPPAGMVGTVTVVNDTGGAKPNLVPFSPDGWSAAIVVSTNPDDFTDDQPLRDDQDLFLDWAVANLSETGVDRRFVTRIFIDDQLEFSWVRDGLAADAWNSSNDNNIGKLAPGPHVIRMEVDADGVVDESDEGDNRFEKRFDVIGSGGGQTHQVDFRNSEFVPNEITIQVGDTVEFTNRGGLHTVTGTGADPFCGSDAIPVSCRVTFSEAGVFPYRCLFHSSAGPPPSGMVGTITVVDGNGGGRPNLLPFQPDGWSDRIVLSTNTGDAIDDKPLFDDQPLFLDWAIANLSADAAVTERFVTRILIDGVVQFTWPNDGLAVQRFVTSDDNPIGTFAAGEHTVRMEVDAENAVVESMEDDNVYVKTFVVTRRGGGSDRVVRIADSSGVPGGAVSVPVTIAAMGDENAVSFSVEFDPATLRYDQTTLGSGAAGAALNINDTQAGAGRIGAALALPTGQTLAAGERQLVLLRFTILANSAIDAPIRFSDSPILREIASAQAAVLPGDYVDGTVRVTAGFEADVTPRPDGNNTVSVTDWVLVGRFAAQLDIASPGVEFMKADCSPRETLGNGVLSLTDWVQAGRYAASLDPLTPAGGPTGAENPQSSRSPGGSPGAAALDTAGNTIPQDETRTVAARSAVTVAGDLFDIEVFMDGHGGENAVGFSLHFDPSILEFQEAVAPVGTSINVNPQAGSPARLGVVLALNSGQTYASGRNELIRLRFRAIEPVASTVLVFQSDPVALELSDVRANALPAVFRDVHVRVLDPTSFVLITSPRFDAAGRFMFNIRSESGALVEIEASDDLHTWRSVGQFPNPTGTTSFVDEEPEVGPVYFRAVKPN